ncbi:hypothetical protein SEA_FIGLIAR_65 [Gordonia phage Figliar]|nr:hypothetical protein SEA_FIGLIAR_65 [Gordonia phage Figliar]
MTIEIEPNCACETQDHEECGNDDHEPGCTCGCAHYLTRLFLPRAGTETYQKQREKDAFRPQQPNVLSFKKVNQSSPADTLVHYWVLRDNQGAHIVGSSHFFQTKEEAMKNCIAIFSKELWAGYHQVPKEDDWEQLLQLGMDMERKHAQNN